MKQLDIYITEKLHLNKDIKEYKYFPEDEAQLMNILVDEKQILKKRKLDLSDIEMSNITNISSAFQGCRNLIEVDLSSWDVSNVTDMGHLFNDCRNLKKVNLSGWNTSKVKDISRMFDMCQKLEVIEGIEDFDTSSVETMEQMFYGCNKFNQDISKWDVSNVINFRVTFTGCVRFNQDLENWEINDKADTKWMLRNTPSLLKKPSWW